MLYGSTSGFGWDNAKQCVVADNTVHKDAAPFKEKSFPHFDDLLVVFGKDRATGKDAVTSADVMEELNRSEPDENANDIEFEDDGVGLEGINFSTTPATEATSTTRNRKRKRKSFKAENFIGEVKELSTNLVRQIGNSFDRLSQTIERGFY
ncbi:hypothetical protein CFOL_v3_02549 [Cephalotus follicularis]|uniref:Myb_DNA-bind_3 domain-containing protein n=1 Tax=Cephalotus follicularis TaxID=3775 RepID=A0A1Q3ATD7_CEPFO|nr:hypothetical protein CFOL_v3_02549 [Cephalotus follicularis]